VLLNEEPYSTKFKPNANRLFQRNSNANQPNFIKTQLTMDMQSALYLPKVNELFIFVS